MNREASLMWTTVPFDSRTLPSHFKAACFRGGSTWPAETCCSLQVTRASSELRSTCGDEMTHANAGETRGITKCCLETQLFGVHSLADFGSGREMCVRCRVLTAGSQSVVCWHLQQAHAGTWTWTGKDAKLRTSLGERNNRDRDVKPTGRQGCPSLWDLLSISLCQLTMETTTHKLATQSIHTVLTLDQHDDNSYTTT